MGTWVISDFGKGQAVTFKKRRQQLYEIICFFKALKKAMALLCPEKGIFLITSLHGLHF